MKKKNEKKKTELTENNSSKKKSSSNKTQKSSETENKKNKKMIKIESTQMYSDIRDVEEGIVITKDRRYVKILEFESVNLSLKSQTEQDVIISSFASAIRIMPNNTQFKVFSNRMDSDKVAEEIVNGAVKGFAEGVGKGKEMPEGIKNLVCEQVDLARMLSDNGAVEKRLLVAFDFEQERDELLQMRSPTWDEIKTQLNTNAMSIIHAMSECGNKLISPEPPMYDNEYILELFYQLMCRSESEKSPFKARMEETFNKHAQHYSDFSKSAYISVNDFICPDIINPKVNTKYMRVGELYYTFMYIPSGAYPTTVPAAWSRVLTDMGEGIDVDFFIKKIPSEQVVQKMLRRIRWNKVKLEETDDTSMDFESLKDAVESGFYLRRGIENDEDFCYFATLLTITAGDIKSLDKRVSSVKKLIRRRSLDVKPCMFKQKEAFKMSMPLCKPDASIFDKSKRNCLSRDLASFYPFSSSELNDRDGTIWGQNLQSGSLVSINNFDKSRYENANEVILGASGAGKTYTLINMCNRFVTRGIQTFAIIPKKGHEFLRTAECLDGKYISISAGSAQNINLLEIRKLDTAVQEVLNGNTATKRSRLDAKISSVRTAFRLIKKDITEDELATLDEALKITYERFGITEDNDSLIDPENPSLYKKMPVIGDLYETLVSMEDDSAAIAISKTLKRFVDGSAQSFNRQTNVSIDSNMIVFDLDDLEEELLPFGMFVVTDFLWDKVREDVRKKKAVVFDELWALIGHNSHKIVANTVVNIFKLIRAYNGAAIASTQDLNDFFSLDDGQYGKAILSACRIKFLLRMEDHEVDAVADMLHLTDAERFELRKLSRGEAIIIAHTDNVLAKFMATPTEHDLADTNPETQKKRFNEKMEALEMQKGA